ncbi:MAG: AtpZ/AtpI family protein [Bacteroidales bacterium]
MPQDSQNDKKKKYLDNYARYSSIALQMMVIIFLGIWGGIKLDDWIVTGFPLFTVLMALLSVSAAIYIVIKDLLKKK